MGRRRRSLTDADREIWNRVTRSVTPNRPEPKGPGDPSPTETALPPTVPDPVAPRLTPFRLGERKPVSPPGHKAAPTVAEQLAAAPVRMDRKTHGRMRKGKLDPEARIDLHGMTQAQAHPALTRFILSSHGRGLRLVLVITGKGKDRDEPGPMPVPRGVLRHQVPHWLGTGVLRGLVQQITPAHHRHGGEGAYYVWLRRLR